MPPRLIQLEVDQNSPRLDHYLVKEFPDLSRSQLKKLIEEGRVFIADRPAKAGAAIRRGDVVTVHLPAPETVSLQPESVKLEIVFEDDDLIVINKAAGMVIHPAHGHKTGTLVNALLSHYPDLEAMTRLEADSAQRPGIVHRLDRDTSGLIIVARSPLALRDLRRQFKARTVEKIYIALVLGQPEAPEGVIDVPLGRDPRQRQKFAPRPDGKAARTHYRLLEKFDGYSLLQIGLETGRTHQIRVHLAWLKCPVAGDKVYGRKREPLGLTRQFLHAQRLRFLHPRSGEPLHLVAPLDEQLEDILGQLRQG